MGIAVQFSRDHYLATMTTSWKAVQHASAQIIQLMQLDVPSALSRRRPGSTLQWAPAFAGVAGLGMSDGASLPDESCE
jgi:hypothetical protein